MLTERNSIHNFILQAGSIGYLISLPYQANINSFFLVILFLNWLLTPNLIKRLKVSLSNKYVLLFISLYLFLLIGMLYTNDMEVGKKILTKSFSIVFFPLLFSSINITESFKLKLFLSFLITLLIGTLVSYYLFYFNYLAINDFYLTFSQGHFRDNYLKFLSIRPTYLTIYLLFSMITILPLITMLKVRGNSIAILVLYFILIYFLFTALLLSARMPLTAAILLFIYFLFHYFLKNKFYLGIASGLAVVVGILYVSFNNPYLNKRFKEITETSFSPPTGESHNSTNIRVGIAYCSFQLLRENWLMGVGTGDSQEHLNRCYKESDFSSLMFEDNYNMHNAYLETWLKNGVLAFILMLCIFVIPVSISLRQKDYIYFSFLILFALSSLTESTLNSQKGIVFYSFFNSLLAFSNPYFKSSKSIIKL